MKALLLAIAAAGSMLVAAQVNAADLLHSSANNLRNEQDKKWVFGNFNAIKNSSATFDLVSGLLS